VPEIESSYSVLTAALVERLAVRPALVNVNVLDHVPVNKDDIRTEVGTFEVIAMAEGIGTFDDVVFCDGGLRFDETLVITVLIEVHGTDSNSTQSVVKARVNQLLYEALADVADQQSWDKAALGLDIFDYLFFTPATQRWSPGRLQQTGVFAAACELGIEARSRRSFP
jgi:hypothetical protein